MGRLLPFPVIHCPFSCGVVLELLQKNKDNFKIVYSGDSRPCGNMVKYGKNADLFIHECTFPKGMEKEAKIKNHSSFKEVIDIGV